MTYATHNVQPAGIRRISNLRKQGFTFVWVPRQGPEPADGDGAPFIAWATAPGGDEFAVWADGCLARVPDPVDPEIRFFA